MLNNTPHSYGIPLDKAQSGSESHRFYRCPSTIARHRERYRASFSYLANSPAHASGIAIGFYVSVARHHFSVSFYFTDVSEPSHIFTRSVNFYFTDESEPSLVIMLLTGTTLGYRLIRLKTVQKALERSIILYLAMAFIYPPAIIGAYCTVIASTNLPSAILTHSNQFPHLQLRTSQTQDVVYVPKGVTE